MRLDKDVAGFLKTVGFVGETPNPGYSGSPPPARLLEEAVEAFRHALRQIELRKLLLRRRTDHGVTQSELARRLGKPQSFVAKYEGGERRLSVIEFIDIAEALQIRPAELLEQLHNILKSSGQQESSTGGKTKPLGKR